MWIQVRSFDGKKSKQIDSLSKLTKIEDLRDMLVEHFEAPVDHQRLFFRGKQLVDGHTLFDYGVGLNDLIQLMVRAPVVSPKKSDIGAGSGDEGSDKENQKPPTPEKKPVEETSSSDLLGSTYKVGDVIDARDLSMGAWFESKIMKVTKSSNPPATSNTEKTKDIKPVLSETSIKDSDNTAITNKSKDFDNKNKKEIKDENANDSAIESMETDEDSSSGIETAQDKKNDIAQDKENSITQDKNNEIAQDKKTDTPVPYDRLFDNVKDDGFVYHMIYEGYDEDDLVELQCKDVRPRARTNIKFSEVKVGDVVMANYNMEDPDTRGFWYDCVITAKQDTRTVKTLTATVYFGPDLTPLENCKLLFIDEVFACEKPGTQLTAEDIASNPSASPVKRTNKPDCDHCLDNPRRKCRHCACCECGGKNDPDKQILCDECNKAYHIGCLTPPLTSIPEEDEWYCPNCKNDDTEIVKAGEKLKESKKKAKMASTTSTSNRDWGKGMACVGRQKVCNIVPSNHFGPIPGVEVGTLWKFRVQVSEAGVHRPHVAGIHGREDEGAYSIVLSGGYEDDTDNGDSFLYTGSGGRDLSGNKRTAEQSCDQQLTRMNRALAKVCNAPIDNKNGATSKDWRGGKPVRVVRNMKGRKHSEYAPEDGNRYDGIYKVVKYWPEKGKSGFLVWRYMMQRDDPNPAPWSKEGKKRIKELGLTMQYPEGYLEAQAQKEKEKEEGGGTPGGKGKGKGKRKRDDDDDDEVASPSKKNKTKAAKYKVDPAQSKLIKEDSVNQKLWEEAVEHTAEGHQKFLAKIEELFTCICCQDIVFKPVTTTCAHNICKSCLQRSFKAEVYSCPACRTDLGKTYEMPQNKTLSQILLKFFPGYDSGR